jgi:hypothetical protein
MRLALIVVAVLAAPASAQAADPQMFETPSRNIACAQFETTLRCDMRQLGNAAPKRPASCEFDYGRAFGVTRAGSKGKRLCVSDAVGGPGTPVVGYGRTWRRGGFVCKVRETGLHCTNKRGHGFELRRGRQRLF